MDELTHGPCVRPKSSATSSCERPCTARRAPGAWSSSSATAPTRSSRRRGTVARPTRCLVDLGFAALSREHKAEPLILAGLAEVPIHVDWSKPDREDRLAAAIRGGCPTGVMFHHAEMDAAERGHAAELFALVAGHRSVETTQMMALV